MAPTLYTPLPIDKFSIRLIKLQPAYTTSAPILCKLVNHPIDSERIVAHSYECLSYVWGPSENPQLISIDTGEAVFPFQTTPNLYEALQHLRDSCFEQILWIDAVCINQRDDEEKATQVAAMARIYGLAKRVIVWLGAETNDSTLAFERLRDLAQPRETEAPPQHRSIWLRHRDDLVDRDPVVDSDVDSDVGRDEDGPVAEHAIQTLLSRPYFRRMWVLQEVAAARNMVFRCGSAEMQTETFRAGLHALARLDDWELRHRILAFLLLIGTSIFRERLKGRPHLEFEPLNDLIDRFHAHDASDPRDKIYALWGLCSDSSSMESLQPNYDKKWKDLFEDLGKLMFGKESAVSASPLRQLMFVRTTGYILGQVEEIPDTITGQLWDPIQELKLAPLRASMLLGYPTSCSVWIKMRAPAEPILEGDKVLFLPHTGKIVFARTSDCYLRIVMVIDSPQVELATRQMNGQWRSSEWRSWQSWLGRVDNVASSLPLLWSWEKYYKEEEDECLILMTESAALSTFAADPIRAKALARAKALSDMSVLFMDYKEYGHASELLASAVPIWVSVWGEESEAALMGIKRMNDALDKKSKYLRARNLLLDSQDPTSTEGFIRDCATGILGESITTHEWIPLDLVVVDIVSKEMSTGVSRELLVHTLEKCEDFEASRPNRMSDNHEDKWKIGSSIQRDNAVALDQEDSQLLGQSIKGTNNYLQFLLELAEIDIFITESELFVAAHKKITESNFIRLAKRIEDPLQNLAAILEALRSTQWPGVTVPNLITELGDRIVVTPDAVNVAAKWDVHALCALLRAANSTPVVAPVAFTVAMQNASASTPAIIELLAQHAEAGCVVPEEAIELIAWHRVFNKIQLQWMFVSLLENIDIVVNVPVNRLFKGASTFGASNILELMRFVGPPSSEYLSSPFLSPWASSGFIKLPQPYGGPIVIPIGEGPLRQVVVDDLSANSITDYASFINLVRYRGNEFTITRDLILKSVNERKKHPEENSWLYGEDQTPWESLLVIDRCTAFLIRHADHNVINSLISSSALIDTAASRGLPRAIEAIYCRSHSTAVHVDALRVVAELCRLLQRPLQPGESFAHMPKIESLIRSLSGMAQDFVSVGVKREIYLHARGGQYNYQVIDILLEHGIIDANAVKIWDGQFLDTRIVGCQDDQDFETGAGHQENYMSDKC